MRFIGFVPYSQTIAALLAKLFKLLWWLSLTGMLIGAIGIAIIVLQVRYSDISLLEKTTILAKMEEETSIYYLDGQERIGSLFSGVHRRYVPLRDIPAHMQNAIIAAEDKNFFLHRGVDYGAILIAFYEGLRQGGRFRRGGSTLTQQTVKNIMGDWETTFARKFREMIKAMQLEQLYDKEQILEFYLNQFHVVGNGNGIGIAANYYFNKDVLDLNLIEAAFIAGSVKSPSRYNPFMKRDQAGLKRALQQGHQRKNYVLTRMFEQKWISAEEYASAKAKPIPFDKGRFTTSDVSLVDMIQAELARKDILKATGLKHISELKTAGLKVYTTIDKDLQRLAQHMSRRHFARIQTILSGLVAEDSSRYKPLKTLKVGEFVFGKVTHVAADAPAPYIELSFGLPTGVLHNKALIRMAKLLNLPEDHPGGHQHFLELLLTQIKVDDVLFVEVKDYDSSTFKATLELYKHPDVSGGLVVLDKGEVRAVVSGFDTLGFNRAIHGKRQPGSVFKIPTLLAALQLGWTILDPLYNNRQVFAYQDQVYFPRPDHPIKYPRPSLIWSGIMSENLAFVHLMVHLLDKLSFPQFKQLLAALHLAPKPRESPHTYHKRVQRRLGVTVDKAGLNQHLLQQAVAITEPDFIFSRDLRRADLVRTLWWGHNYTKHMQSLYREDRQQYSATEIETRLNLVRNNYQRYQRLLASYHTDLMLLEYHLERHDARQVFYLEDLATVIPRFGVIHTATGPQLIYHRIFADEVYQPSDNEPYEETLKAEIASEYDKEMLEQENGEGAQNVQNIENMENVEDAEQTEPLATEFATAGDEATAAEAADEEREHAIATRLYGVMAGWPVVPLYSIGGDPASDKLRALRPEDLDVLLDKGLLTNPEATLLDGRMPVSIVRFIENYIATELVDLHREQDPYKLKHMFSHHDFRIALGLQYLKQLCRILGVRSYINPVISLPLGTNVVTTADIARLFQAVATGHIYQFFPDDEPNQIAFIRRIEDRYGKVLYAAESKTYSVLHPLILSQLTDVLRKIVTHGTGRRAGREMYVDLAETPASSAPAALSSRYKIRIPAYGKTGSTNDFTTSYFAGLTPYPVPGSDRLSLSHIYTMAAYVGYDIPQMMERGRISIYGGTGALPLWTDFFRQVIRLKDYRSHLDAYDLDLITNQEWAVHRDHSQWEPVRVDLPRGLVLGPITEKYVEDYTLTNLAETGEEYVNEFLNIHSVIGAVNAPAPLDLSRPLPRMFEPLTPKLLHQKIKATSAAGEAPP